MKGKEDKTNVMRMLDQKKVSYIPHGYEHADGEPVDAVSAAAKLGRDPDDLFKTLVTRGSKGGFYVFVIPGSRELDLKKAAKSASEKSVEMIKVSELLDVTGYIRGGCSPIGMKKTFPTFFDESVTEHDTVLVSAGRIGRQVEMKPSDLLSFVRAKTADLTVK